MKKSLETFADVFGSSVTYGIFSGEHKEMDAQFLFATNITMCKSLELFAKNEFDYIIIIPRFCLDIFCIPWYCVVLKGA